LKICFSRVQAQDCLTESVPPTNTTDQKYELHFPTLQTKGFIQLYFCIHTATASSRIKYLNELKHFISTLVYTHPPGAKAVYGSNAYATLPLGAPPTKNLQFKKPIRGNCRVFLRRVNRGQRTACRCTLQRLQNPWAMAAKASWSKSSTRVKTCRK
jgi:hypothetical protein